MINLIFTLDYEVYGDGTGSLEQLVYEPAEKLSEIFRKHQVPFVSFVEAAELEVIESKGIDEAVFKVKDQIRSFYRNGIELGLHLHPQWYGAKYENEKWLLDYSEYNLCVLPEPRIEIIVKRSISYLRNILGEPEFTPLAFRAGNWLFQPTEIAANVLSAHGLKVDSSVFKGGRQHQNGLDYRMAIQNGYYWTFHQRVERPDPNGVMLELPIYTRMVPFWDMLTSKRVSIQAITQSQSARTAKHKVLRLLDYFRFRYPLKLDFCRMTIDELCRMTKAIIREDKKNPGVYRPIVAIGHTKDLRDLDTVDAFLGYLKDHGIPISTFSEVYPRCLQGNNDTMRDGHVPDLPQERMSI